jgi:cysteine synthase
MKLLSYFDNIIGNTPLMCIHSKYISASIYAKCEWTNHFGSIKDRPALAMIKRELQKDSSLLGNINTKIIEYTGGNLGVSLAGICHYLGINVTLILPKSVPLSYIEKIKSYLANIIFTDPNLGFLGVINKAKKVAKSDRDYRFLYQHNNPANISCHRNATAKEVVDQAKGFGLNNISAFVASIGTGASLIGIYQGLKNYGYSPYLYSVMPKEMPYGTYNQPSSKTKFAGSGGLGYGSRQFFVKSKENLIRKHFVYSIDDCYRQMKEFYDEYGILIGTSSAANLLAAKVIAQKLSSNDSVLTLFPSLATSEEKHYFGMVL